MQPWQPYIDSVKSGKRLAGKLERLAVERFERTINDPRYHFDTDAANWAITLVAAFKHTKGDYKGVPFQLTGWQKFFLARIFGLKYKDSGLRVTRKVLLEIAKKGGKSEFAAAIAVVTAFFDGEQAAECYMVANKRDQAKYCFNSAVGIVKHLQDEGELLDVRIYNSQQGLELVSKIEGEDREPDGSSIKAIATDSDTLDGQFTSTGIIDEYHAAVNTDVMDNLESGGVSRSQPLTVIITTRGFNLHGPLWNLEQSYELILEGMVENDATFILIFAMDEGDDWEAEANWEKSNPNVGITPTWEGLRALYKTAKTEGTEQVDAFKTKSLNMWVSSSKTWIDRDDYLQAGSDFDETDLHGRVCYAGLDLASSKDLTAWALLFPPTPDDPKFRCLVRFWVPKGNARKRAKKQRVPYIDWAEKGWIGLTDRRTTDYAVVEEQIRDDFDNFTVRLANYDRFNASDLINRLEDDQIPMSAFNQSFINFNPAIKALEEIILEGMFDHQNNPVLAWNFKNTILKSDAGGNRRPDKARSKEKIDGVVALAMAKAAYLNREPDTPPYNGEVLFW